MTKRTPQQNKAINKYCSMLADEFGARGLDMKAVLKPEVEIPWTTESVKNHIWRPVRALISIIDVVESKWKDI